MTNYQEWKMEYKTLNNGVTKNLKVGYYYIVINNGSTI